MVTKWPLSQQGKHELTPHLLKVFILRWMEVSCSTDGRLMVATPLMEDRTDLNMEDFKGLDRVHQTIDHFAFLWSKGT